jgi:hypothetical protein
MIGIAWLVTTTIFLIATMECMGLDPVPFVLDDD